MSDNAQYISRSGKDIAKVYAEEVLAAYAAKEDWEKVEDRELTDNRSVFQRDRDRIIHSQAFRHLMYKTQVFVNHESDHFRTRLTHTLEVSQLARGVCKSLGLNEDLAEAIALGHDLGHTPFGHAVEKYFDGILKERDTGRFFHNEQSVRVVELLENRTEKKAGLELSKEVREGILKHNKDDRSGVFLDLDPYNVCSHLEGQIVQIVDTIAYICHDFEDAIKAGIVYKTSKKNETFADELDNIVNIIDDIINKDKKTNERVNVTFEKYEDTFFIRHLIHQLIIDLTDNTYSNIVKSGIHRQSDIVNHPQLATLSDQISGQFKELKTFIYNNIYNSQTVAMMDDKAVDVIKYMFEKYTSNPHLLPPEWLYKHDNAPQTPPYSSDKSGTINNKTRVIIDYISCMTDRFALDEHERLSNPRIKI